MKNTSKGFTLIELLAVIVILAIIALIATPIILGVIEKAIVGAAESSSLGYVDAIEKQVMINQVKNENMIEDGVYDAPMSGISLKGQAPTSGWFKLEKGQVTDYSFVIGEYVVTKGAETIKGDTATAKPEGGSVAVKAYALGELVYFDPVSTTKCDEKSTSATCYKWRVIETNDSSAKSNITLQMDHNLINLSVWITKEDYILAGGTADDYGNNNKGPVTALKALNEATTSWVRVNNLTYEYDTTAATSNYGKLICNDGACTINGTSVLGTAKARIITGEEVTKITNEKVEDQNALSKTWTVASSSSDYFYFSHINYTIGTHTSATGTGDTNLKWLVENTKNYPNSGATANTYEAGNNGYWTLSPNSSTSTSAWGVYNYGRLRSSSVYIENTYGVRPVITILKSNL